jgi:hypothetical protein
MASGRDTKLAAAAGEFLVAAELSRRGLLATPFAGNVPDFDVIAISENGLQTLVQVKASNGGRWSFTATRLFEVHQDGDFQRIGDPLPSPYPELVWIFVELGAVKAAGRDRDRFFVMPYAEAQRIIANHYREYLASHGGRRPKSPESKHVMIRADQLAEHEDAWGVILDRP